MSNMSPLLSVHEAEVPLTQVRPYKSRKFIIFIVGMFSVGLVIISLMGIYGNNQHNNNVIDDKNTNSNEDIIISSDLNIIMIRHGEKPSTGADLK